MKKILILIFIVFLLFWGCREVQLDDSALHQAISYSAGKAMAIGINRLAPQVDADLSQAWARMMQSNAGNDAVSPDELLIFYNDMISIVSRHTHDPYNLVGDLGVLLIIFGAQYNGEGGLIKIEAVPMPVMQWFERGYVSGRRVAVRGGV